METGFDPRKMPNLRGRSPARRLCSFSAEPRCHAPKNGQTPSVVEILGPAGSGKTTLLRVLTQRWQRIAANVDLGRSHCLPFLIRNVTVRWPGFLREYRRGRWFTWSETRSMVYLEAWHRHLADGRITVFDQGPLFRLARLRAFGPELTRSAVYTQWQDDMLRRWTSTLDVVVCLDAPNDVLCERIDARESRHRIQRHTVGEMHEFLRRYRRSFEEVLRPFAATGRSKIVRFNTASESTDQLADRVLATLGFSTEER